jgi:GR25 family glycosyltransferase involved in LPS biosynthesis
LKKIINRLTEQEKIDPTVNKIKYPVYYINMDKDKKRRLHMEAELKNFCSKFTRVRGANGYNISDKSHDTVDGIVEFENEYNKLTKPEIGCLLSHFVAIQKAYDAGVDVVVRFEDDITFKTRYLTPSLHTVIDNAPADWEILQLWACITESEYKKVKSDKKFEYLKRKYPNRLFWCCGCYAINRAGMKKILESIKAHVKNGVLKVKIGYLSPDFPPRGEADSYIYDLVNTYTIFPNLFVVNNLELSSTIHDEDTNTHIKTSLFALKNLL